MYVRLNFCPILSLMSGIPMYVALPHVCMCMYVPIMCMELLSVNPHPLGIFTKEKT